MWFNYLKPLLLRCLRKMSYLLNSRKCQWRRHVLPRCWVQCVLCVLCLISLTMYVHLYWMDKILAYYHEDCLLQEPKKERMRFMLRHVVNFMNEEGVTYWLEYGTLLGVMRDGDIIAYDGDVDVSRLADNLTADGEMVSRFTEKMKVLGIEVSATVARYYDAKMDLYRWQNRLDSSKPLLERYVADPRPLYFVEKVSNYLFPLEIPSDILFPLRQISMFGVLANIPHMPMAFLKRRFPLTWFWDSFPYKWKCWVLE